MGDCGKKGGCGGCNHGHFLIRDFCIQQFPFLAEDFDALTTWELLQKVICYLKQIHQFTEEMEQAYKDLVKYVKDTLGNLDNIVGDILQEMYEDGRITNLIDNLFLQMEDRCKKIVYVNCYGAKGDGVTDDTVAIQNAIDDNPFGIFIFHGTYKITDTLNIKFGSQTFLLTDLRWHGATGKPAIKITNEYASQLRYGGGVVISGGCVSGVNADDTTMTCGIQVCTTSVRIDNVHVRSFLEYGILLSDNIENPRELIGANMTGAALIDNTIITNFPKIRGTSLCVAYTDIKISNCNFNGAKHCIDYFGGNLFICNTHLTPTTGYDYVKDACDIYVYPYTLTGNMVLYCNGVYFNGIPSHIVYVEETTSHCCIFEGCAAIYGAPQNVENPYFYILGSDHSTKMQYMIDNLKIRAADTARVMMYPSYTGSYKDMEDTFTCVNLSHNPPTYPHDVRAGACTNKQHLINSALHKLQPQKMLLVGELISTSQTGIPQKFLLNIGQNRIAEFTLSYDANHVYAHGTLIGIEGNVRLYVGRLLTVSIGGTVYYYRRIYLGNIGDTEFKPINVSLSCLDDRSDVNHKVLLFRVSNNSEKNFTFDIEDTLFNILEELTPQ